MATAIQSNFRIRKNLGRIQRVIEVPNLIDIQRASFDQFLNEGLRETVDDISPIQDFTGGRMELRFGDYHFEEPKYTETECRDRERTYAAPLRVSVELLVKETGEVKEQTLFMGDTLRGLLMTTYAFWTFGQIAMYAAWACWIGAALFLLLALLGFRHAKNAAEANA